MTRRLLTIGHSYVVAQNRRLAHEMARAGAGAWDVTAVGPARLRGDLREIRFEPIDAEASHPVPVRVRFGGHAHLRVYGSPLRAILRQPWDVVHCWEEPYVLAAGQVARWMTDGPRFVPATFQNITKRYPPPSAFIERMVMARAAGWIAFGESVREALKDRPGYAGRPSRVISPGVDVEAFHPDASARARTRKRLGFGDEAFVGAFVGRFVEQKGIRTLIEALALARRPWCLLFVGGGPLTSEIEQARSRHPSRVRLATDVPHDDVPAWLAAADVLCAPSRTTPRWREQFGRMLIEAMACGLPVVASPSGEIPHVVSDAGLLVGEDDVARWAATLDTLSEDRVGLAAMSGRALARAHAVYAWPIVARRHLDFFEELCGS